MLHVKTAHRKWPTHFISQDSYLVCVVYKLQWLCSQHTHTKCYLEPASGTPQRTCHFHSSQTLPLSSGGDTCPRPPARGGRRETLGSRSDTALQPELPATSPETKQPLYSECTEPRRAQPINTYAACSPSPCTCPRTCPQTCSGWQRWRGALRWHCRAGGNSLWKWHCHLKEKTHQDVTQRQKNTTLWDVLGDWTQLPSKQLPAADPWWWDPVGTLCRSAEALTCPQTEPLNSVYILAAWWWPLTAGPPAHWWMDHH